MSPKLVRVLLPLVVLSGTGCSLIRLIERNTETVQASTAGIAANTEVVRRSSMITESLLPALQSVGELQGPMESVGALSPTLRAVAALETPMSRLAALDTSMGAVAGLQQPMTRLVEIRPSLDATAALGPSMERLAEMRSSLDAVASLRESMDRVSALEPALASLADLRAPMEGLGMLREPITRLATLGIVGRPFFLVLLAVVALGAWGGVTFVAVRMAIISAARVTPLRG